VRGERIAKGGVAELRTAAIRRAVLAPELERFLSRKSVDLLVTDQIEAIAVRVRKGIEVLDRKIEAGIEVARKRIAVLTLCGVAGLLLLIPHCLAWADGKLEGRDFATLLLWGLAGLVLIALFVVDIALVRAFADKAQLQHLAGRYTRGVDEAGTIGELLAHAEIVLNAARKLGAVPKE